MNKDISQQHQCRPLCGACCIAPGITSYIPGMPNGKPPGVRCIHLTDELLCDIFDAAERPAVCRGFTFDPLICGSNAEEAMSIQLELEDIPFEKQKSPSGVRTGS